VRQHPRAVADLREQTDMTKRTCTKPGCGMPHVARGLCNNHYQVERRAGFDPLPDLPPLKERLLARIKVDDNDCWIWQGYANPTTGYGMFTVERRTQPVHRLMYTVLVGPIPHGRHTDHLCRVHACANPAHLEIVTARVNILRGVGPSALHAVATHCVHGHEFTPENTYVVPNRGTRQCRTCNRVREEARKARRRAVAAIGARKADPNDPT
jgi:HNH endonuclease